MDAAEAISLADAMRAHALKGGRDLNDANLFAHIMLMRRMLAERDDEQRYGPPASSRHAAQDCISLRP